ncbi:MAG: hypothetical protein PWP08_1822 [Methanofollis sp.]|nr:hypothetical protein [Methanofollis sp.]
MGRTEKFFDAYIEKIRPAFEGMGTETGHAVASALLGFKFGLYSNAVTRADMAIEMLATGGMPQALTTALEILRTRAADLKNAVLVSAALPAFAPEDREYLAMDLSPDLIEDPTTYTLDNALLLLYAVGLIASPDDEQALDEHRGFPIQILNSYRKQLDL